ncbi:hypothetical protein ACFFRR_004828 [Megaselia abdita]
MATQNLNDLIQGERRRLKIFSNAMGDGYRNPDFRKPLANKKVQAEEDNYSTDDDFRAGDRTVYNSPPQKYMDIPHSEKYQQQQYLKHPPISRKEFPLKPVPQQESLRQNKNKFEQLQEKFIQANKIPGKHISKTKFRSYYPGHDSDPSDMTYTNDNYFNDQFIKPDLKKQRPKKLSIKPSARSNGTTRSKKAEELVKIQTLKSDIIEVIQDGIQKIEKTTCEKPSRESQILGNSTTSFNQNSSDIFQSDVVTTFVKELRDNHLGNILHEVKNLHFLDSLPERCLNDLNKKRDF